MHTLSYTHKEMSSVAVSVKSHAVCIPVPVQSHVKAMMKLAKLLHHRGFNITFIITESYHERLLKSLGSNSLDGLPDFQFKTIPDCVPPSEPDANQDMYWIILACAQQYFLAPFRDLLAELNDSTASSNNPPVTCIVCDVFTPFAITAAEELGIPVILFSPVPACAFMGYYQHRSLLERGLVPLKDESYRTNGYLDTVIDWIPGMKDIRLKDLPSSVRTTDPNDGMMFNFCMEAAEGASRASAIVVHSFDALEQDILDALSHMFPFVYSIGPLQLLLNQTSESDDEEHLKIIGYNLWNEEPECLKWLDSKEPNSVIYVNYGSLIGISSQELVEFGWGLANSKHSFLWIIRPDLVEGGSAILPEEFAVETRERGLVASWCPQELVLKHPSVGGFLTHCGWNSTIESLSSGVPMLCWPICGDQQTNCRYMCNEWGIGMEIDIDVRRDEVDRLVRELMEGDQGKKMKSKALEWKKLAEKATSRDGSSSLNLDKLVTQFTQSRH